MLSFAVWGGIGGLLVSMIPAAWVVLAGSTDVEVWSRTGDSWSRKVHVEPTDSVQLPAIGVSLSVDALYQGADRYPSTGG